MYGLEFFGEYKISDMWCDSCNYQVEIFGNTALVNSRYINPDDRSIHNNQVEYAPNLNVKAGVTYKRDKLSCTLQSSYTSKQFSDASNAVFIQNAIVGEIPSYLIFDFSMALQLHKNISIESGINNFANESYFTKRTSGYPGPGILPAAGRNAYLTLEVRL